MGGRPSSKSMKATKKVVPLFQHFYEDKHGKPYNVNWPMIKSAEKVGDHYSVEQIETALEYYFRVFARNDLWTFISTVDSLYSSGVKEEEALANLEQLKVATKRRLEEFGE